MTCSTLSVKSQPSSAASSAPPSARKHAPQYDAAKAAKAALKAEEGSPVSSAVCLRACVGDARH